MKYAVDLEDVLCVDWLTWVSPDGRMDDEQWGSTDESVGSILDTVSEMTDWSTTERIDVIGYSEETRSLHLRCSKREEK